MDGEKTIDELLNEYQLSVMKVCSGLGIHINDLMDILTKDMPDDLAKSIKWAYIELLINKLELEEKECK